MPIFYEERRIISARDIGGLSSRSLLTLALCVCTLWAWEPAILAVMAAR